MIIEVLVRFFMWCSVLNLALLALSVLAATLGGEYLYRMHGRWFSLPREQFKSVIFTVISLYKIGILLFCIVPWITLLIIS